MTDKKILNVPERDLPTSPLGRADIAQATKERLDFINQEFKAGFDFVNNHPRSVTFFGSSRLNEADKYYQQAQSLAQKIVQVLGYSVVSGGGPGVMEAANRGAYESGGESLGLTIELPNEQARNPYVTKFKEFYYFFTRKVCLAYSAEAFVFFPGGFGTFDELFEIMTLVQTNKIPPVPVILFGNDFWPDIEKYLFNELKERRMIDKKDMSLYTITEDEKQILELISQTPVQTSVPFKHANHNHNQAHK